ncbi:vacuolar fusion protein MON1 homolog B-like [Symsagittifera roscoffensis]|uniref:vacuolar fusion protein MON1 homolog B-like n=1 Tax=Symsagittifera roscoffensis TaxID=84072 RepID=UPI00307BF465
MYKQRQLLQFTAPAFSLPYDTPVEQCRLFQLYKQIHHKLHSGQRPFKIVYQATDSEIILGWLTSIFEVYCCFTPVISKDDAIGKVNKVVEMVRNEEDKLFLVNAYTF